MQPVHFVIGVHIHQPVGNFDHVFEQHVRDVYLPFLTALTERDFFPIALHVSGPLLEWLDRHDTAYLNLVGKLASDGRLELLLSGLYEPILASLSSTDRVEQVEWMREALHRRFGVEATGLWLTERVWEPALAADLAEARVEYVLVDDRHFLVSGFERRQLHWPYRTESNCRGLSVLPIDERLRYLVPFRPPSETAHYLTSLRERGYPLAVLADDGEKFGGWPGTKEWVYERGWLRDFLDTMQQVIEHGDVVLTTPQQAVRNVESGGLAYLPTTSYREMEEWSLPPEAAVRLHGLTSELGEERLHGPDGALVRGGHWRHFLVKYPESNRMHKKMCRLSQLCRERGNDPDPRREIARAQCNDAYWHGVFGGLYLPHLREAIWQHLSRAEAMLRRGEPLGYRIFDFNGDGHDEIWIHSSRFSAIVAPRRGGALEEYTIFDVQANFANVLTRTIEAYHRIAMTREPVSDETSAEAQSIHALERSMAVTALPSHDLDPRAIFLDRVLPASLSEESYANADYAPDASWAGAPFHADVSQTADGILLRLVPAHDRRLMHKELRFADDGSVATSYAWDSTAFARDAWFSTELSLSKSVALTCDPQEQLWSYAIATVAKSERGLEETVQGLSMTPRWPASAGQATVRLNPYGAADRAVVR